MRRTAPRSDAYVLCIQPPACGHPRSRARSLILFLVRRMSPLVSIGRDSVDRQYLATTAAAISIQSLPWGNEQFDALVVRGSRCRSDRSRARAPRAGYCEYRLGLHSRRTGRQSGKSPLHRSSPAGFVSRWSSFASPIARYQNARSRLPSSPQNHIPSVNRWRASFPLAG